MLCEEITHDGGELAPPVSEWAPRRQPVDLRHDIDTPRTVVGWLPFLWTRVLFPASVRRAGAWQMTHFLVVAFVSGTLLFPCLSFYLFEPDEGRYAQIPREMLEGGDWVVPRLQGDPYLDKPPLFYWLVMASFSLFGFHDWAARLVPALAVEATVLICYLFGRRLVGERSAFLGTLVLSLLPGFVGVGRLLVLDGVLALWVTISLFSALLAVEGPRLRWGWWLLASLACGLGVLTKGPIAVILLVPPLWLHRRLNGAICPIGRRGWLMFVGVVLAVALPWYIAVCCRLPEFVRYFLWEHNVVRFLQPFDHERPVWFYAPLLLLGLLPGTLLLPAFVRFCLAGNEEVARQRCPVLGFLLLAAGWCLLFFSLSGCKLPTYILPAFPPLALAIGCFLARTRWGHSRWTWGVAWSWWGLMLVAHLVLLPWYARVKSPMNEPERMRNYCADPSTPVICFPRNVDSAAFYLGRSDFRSYRSKELAQVLELLDKNPRTVVLFGHRNSLNTLETRLPPHLHVTAAHEMGLCDMAVVERRR